MRCTALSRRCGRRSTRLRRSGRGSNSWRLITRRRLRSWSLPAMMWRRLSGISMRRRCVSRRRRNQRTTRSVQTVGKLRSSSLVSLHNWIRTGVFARTSRLRRAVEVRAHLRSRRWWNCVAESVQAGLGFKPELVPGVFRMVVQRSVCSLTGASPLSEPLSRGGRFDAGWRRRLRRCQVNRQRVFPAHRAMMSIGRARARGCDHAGISSGSTWAVPGHHGAEHEAGNAVCSKVLFGPEMYTGRSSTIKPTATGTGRRPRTTPRGIPVTWNQDHTNHVHASV